jgi:uncharacterized membrane protein YgcG
MSFRFRLSEKLVLRRARIPSSGFRVESYAQQTRPLFSYPRIWLSQAIRSTTSRRQHTLQTAGKKHDLIYSLEMLPEDVPNPSAGTDKESFRSQLAEARISDPNKLLSITTFWASEEALNLAACQIAVAVISRMNKQFVTNAGGREDAAATFAKKVHDLWGVGTAEKNDGVLIFIAVEDRVLYISVGEGMLNRLDSVAIRIVFDAAVSTLKEGNLDLAVQNAVKMVSEASTSSAKYRGSSSNSGHKNGRWNYALPSAFLFLMFLGIAQLSLSARKEGKKEAAVRVVQDDTLSCPHCLEPYEASPNNRSISRVRNTLSCGHAVCTACMGEMTREGCGVCLSSPAKYRVERYKHYYGPFLGPYDGLDEFMRDVYASVNDVELHAAVASFQTRIQESTDHAERKKRLAEIQKRNGEYRISKDVSWPQDRDWSSEHDSSFGGGRSARGGGGSW